MSDQYVSLGSSPTTSASGNLSAEANALANTRSAYHVSQGGVLVGLVVQEYCQYPAATNTGTIMDADVANPGVSTREIAGTAGSEGLNLRQTVTHGTVPVGPPSNYPVQSLA